MLPDGEVVELGGKALDPEGPDLLGVVVGSEGTLGIVTRVTLRIVRTPQASGRFSPAFTTMDEAGCGGLRDRRGGDHALGDRDDGPPHDRGRRVRRRSPATRTVPGPFSSSSSTGSSSRSRTTPQSVERICTECGAFEIRAATSAEDRARLWKGRKSAFAAMGRIATDYYVQDGVVPRTRLPDVLRRIEELSVEHGLRVGNVFHAGDGNLHPLVLYDAEAGETERARELAERSSRHASTRAGL